MANLFNSSARFETYQDFLTLDERAEIQRAVNAMRSDWVPLIPSHENKARVESLLQRGVGFYTLGDAVYVMLMNRQGAETVNQELRQKMLSTFGWLYDRLLAKLTEVTGVPSSLHPLTVPGFQISTVPFEYVMPYYHVDGSMVWYDERAQIEHIYSLVSAIDMSESCGFLEYLDEDEQGMVWVRRLEYEEGALHTWSGTVPHRIGDFQVEDNHQRLTFQAHMFHDPRENCNWVYF